MTANSPSSQPDAAAADPAISIDDFQRVDMRVGRVVAVEEFERARRPSYRLAIDLGPLGTRRSSAGVKPYYTKDELVGRQVVCVVNFPPRNIAGFMSEVLVLGATEVDGRLRLLRPDQDAELGSRIS